MVRRYTKNRKEEYILLNNIINSCINKINLSVPSGEIYYLLNSLPKIRIRWNEMLNIKLIACDIDGTLLDDNKNISSNMLNTINLLKEKI